MHTAHTGDTPGSPGFGDWRNCDAESTGHLLHKATLLRLEETVIFSTSYKGTQKVKLLGSQSDMSDRGTKE